MQRGLSVSVGEFMKRIGVVFLVLASLMLASCNLHRTTPSGGGGGNSTFSVTVTDLAPAGATVLFFKFTITGLTVTSSTGTPVALISASSAVPVELTRLQADGTPLGTFTIASGTYNSLNVTVANVDISFANQSGAAIGQCLNGSVCEIRPAGAGNLTVSTAPFPITVAGGGKGGVSLDFNLANAITSTVGVDFTQPNVLTAAALPLPNQPAGQLESISDVAGIVQTVNASSQTFSLQSSRGTFAVSGNSTTLFDNFTNCPANNFTCLQNNMVVSADLALNSDGTFTAIEINLEDAAPDDEITGVVFSINSATQFQMVALDKVQAAAGSLIGGVNAGNLVTVNLASGPTFVVDSKGLVIPQSPLTLFQGSSDTTQMLGGQVVEVRVKTFTAATPPANASLTTDRVRLRFSVISGAVSLAVNPSINFNLGTLPPLLTNQNLNSLQVQTQLKTSFEGITDINGLASNDSVSVRGLFFNGTTAIVVAAKVRKH
jgi:hypothetical protein